MSLMVKMRSVKKVGKKGNAMDVLSQLGIGIASLAILLVVTFLIMAQARTQIVAVEGINVSNASTYTVAFNATNTLVGAVATVPPWVPLIVITVIGGAMITLVSLFRRSSR